MEKQFILVPVTEINVYKERFSNYRKDKTGYFIQDSIDTTRIVKLDDGEYYLLKWRGSKPAEVDVKYDEAVINPKEKIYEKEALLTYLDSAETKDEASVKP